MSLDLDPQTNMEGTHLLTARRRLPEGTSDAGILSLQMPVCS